MEQRKREKSDVGSEIAQRSRQAVPVCDIHELERSTCFGTQRTQRDSGFRQARFREKNTQTRRLHDCTLLI